MIPARNMEKTLTQKILTYTAVTLGVVTAGVVGYGLYTTLTATPSPDLVIHVTSSTPTKTLNPIWNVTNVHLLGTYFGDKSAPNLTNGWIKNIFPYFKYARITSAYGGENACTVNRRAGEDLIQMYENGRGYDFSQHNKWMDRLLDSGLLPQIGVKGTPVDMANLGTYDEYRANQSVAAPKDKSQYIDYIDALYKNYANKYSSAGNFEYYFWHEPTNKYNPFPQCKGHLEEVVTLSDGTKFDCMHQRFEDFYQLFKMYYKDSLSKYGKVYAVPTFGNPYFRDMQNIAWLRWFVDRVQSDDEVDGRLLPGMATFLYDLDYRDYLDSSIRSIKDILSASEFKDLPIWINESGIAKGADTLGVSNYGASDIARVFKEVADKLGATEFNTWLSNHYFSGEYWGGEYQYPNRWIKTPMSNVFKMLDMMKGSSILPITIDGSPSDIKAVSDFYFTQQGDRYYLWGFYHKYTTDHNPSNPPSLSVQLDLSKLNIADEATYSIKKYLIDDTHSNFLDELRNDYPFLSRFPGLDEYKQDVTQNVCGDGSSNQKEFKDSLQDLRKTYATYQAVDDLEMVDEVQITGKELKDYVFDMDPWSVVLFEINLEDSNVVCRGASAIPTEVEDGQDITYSVAGAYTDGWIPGIRYEYAPSIQEGDTTTFAVSGQDEYTLTADASQGEYVTFLTNLKKSTADGSDTYHCRWNGEWSNPPGPPSGMTNDNCVNECEITVHIVTPTPTPGIPVPTNTPGPGVPTPTSAIPTDTPAQPTPTTIGAPTNTPAPTPKGGFTPLPTKVIATPTPINFGSGGFGGPADYSSAWVMGRPSTLGTWLYDNPDIKIIVFDAAWSRTEHDWSSVRQELDSVPDGHKAVVRLFVTGYTTEMASGGFYKDYYTPESVLNDHYVEVTGDIPECNARRLDYVAHASEIRDWVASFANEFKDNDKLLGVIYGTGVAGEASPWIQTTYATCNKDKWKQAYLDAGYGESAKENYLSDYLVPVADALADGFSGTNKQVQVHNGSTYMQRYIGKYFESDFEPRKIGIWDSGLDPGPKTCTRSNSDPNFSWFNYKPAFGDDDFINMMRSAWMQRLAPGRSIHGGNEFGGSHSGQFMYVPLVGGWWWNAIIAAADGSSSMAFWNNVYGTKPGYDVIDKDVVNFINKYVGTEPKDNDTVWIVFKGRHPDYDSWCPNFFNYPYGIASDLELSDRWTKTSSFNIDSLSKAFEYSDTTKSQNEDWRHLMARYVGDGGANHDILLDVDDDWKARGPYVISLSYYDDTGTIKVYYTTSSGEKLLDTITKTGTNGFVEKEWDVNDISFDNGIPANYSAYPINPSNGFDIRINDGGDGRDLLHMLSIKGKGFASAPTLNLPEIKEGYFHPGIDIKPQYSTLSSPYIYSTHAGFVTYAGPAPATVAERGWMVQIESDLDKDNVPDVITRYTHMMPGSLRISDVRNRRFSFTPGYFASLITNGMSKLPFGYGPYVARNQLLGVMGDSGSPGHMHIQYEITTNRFVSLYGQGLDTNVPYACIDDPYVEACFNDLAHPGFFFPDNSKKPNRVNAPVYTNAGFVTPPPPLTPIVIPSPTPTPTPVPPPPGGGGGTCAAGCSTCYSLSGGGGCGGGCVTNTSPDYWGDVHIEIKDLNTGHPVQEAGPKNLAPGETMCVGGVGPGNYEWHVTSNNSGCQQGGGQTSHFSC